MCWNSKNRTVYVCLCKERGFSCLQCAQLIKQFATWGLCSDICPLSLIRKIFFWVLVYLVQPILNIMIQIWSMSVFVLFVFVFKERHGLSSKNSCFFCYLQILFYALSFILNSAAFHDDIIRCSKTCIRGETIDIALVI